MSTPAQPAGNAAAEGDQRQQGGMGRFMGVAQQMFLMWAVSQLATKYLSGKKPPTEGPATTMPSHGGAEPVVSTNPHELAPQQLLLGWDLGTELSMHVYLTTEDVPDLYFGKPPALPHFVWNNIKFGDWNDHRTADYLIDFPDVVKNNGSIYADIFLTKNGASPDPHERSFDSDDVQHVRRLITPYYPRERVRKVKNLLTTTEDGEEEEELEADVILPHWHQNITLALVSDAAQISYAQAPPATQQYVQVIPRKRDSTGTKAFYKPIIFANEFWHLREHYDEINSTTPALPVRFTFQPMSYMKFQIFASMTQGFKDAASQQGGAAAAELDTIKRMFIETNPYFLALTGFVTLLHMLFEMLAFKNDVSHWREKKEMVGVSVRTIITNVFVQLIILLYLIDNNEKTSWVILFTQGTGIAIEAWKITKAVDIRLVANPPGPLPYKLDITDKHVLSEDEKKTQEYDKLAFRYVSYVAIPLLMGYTVYSLMYEVHRGWYSFTISTLTSFVYMFGFAQLVPQLIINYKLKSVAHMPMKAMIYKTLSTVVDDFFAFCIKMPFLHRLACFRDDVVFLVFLYQRWIYRIDPKRVNEYGQIGVHEIDAVKEKEAEPETKESKKEKVLKKKKQ
ncbi:cleft lip and palate associated transmembrane protein [Cylindrobasidium torrendii FP15055 ss-10]|uniref:Cleft lip and palate associated transmembrane protein n=1 Tax=Cylindrobasidium torrendii FP15055 ss-10 TaxID=1314674 RepID=A0A0D7BNF8_9AGAR|nr:cleft lip and palate associated transmembrane protein [Cylindrobasidium torrendii FP15055 ss-10]